MTGLASYVRWLRLKVLEIHGNMEWARAQPSSLPVSDHIVPQEYITGVVDFENRSLRHRMLAPMYGLYVDVLTLRA